MKKLNVGIIGLGVGENHLKAYISHPNCNVILASDFSKEKCNEITQKYQGIIIAENPNDILENPKIDIVSIASYDNYHFDQIIKALGHGKHVFVEKPICLYEHEAIEIKKKLNENPELKFSSNMVLRTCPRFIRIKESVESGEMGSLFYLEGDYLWGRINKLTEGWRKDMNFYSIIYGAAIHMIDLVIWITGKKPIEVQAYGNKIATQKTQLSSNSFAVILMKFEDNTIAKITANGGSVHPHFHSLKIYGTNKTVIHELVGSKWITKSDNDFITQDVTEDYPAKEKRHNVIYSFIDSILDDTKKPLVGREDVFDSMSVSFAAEQAIANNSKVNVNYI